MQTTADCIPPHARALPVHNDGGRCSGCQKKIASLEGLLSTLRADYSRLQDEYRLEHAVNRVLARDLIEARAALTGLTP